MARTAYSLSSSVPDPVILYRRSRPREEIADIFVVNRPSARRRSIAHDVERFLPAERFRSQVPAHHGIVSSASSRATARELRPRDPTECSPISAHKVPRSRGSTVTCAALDRHSLS